MAVVAGVLLHHVDQELAQRDRSVLGTAPGDVEAWRVGDELLGEGNLITPRCPCLGDNGGVRYCAVEVAACSGAEE